MRKVYAEHVWQMFWYMKNVELILVVSYYNWYGSMQMFR